MADSKQKVLVIKIDNEEIISKVFDFKAFCLIQDVLVAHDTPPTIYTATDAAVRYMFEGTKATDKVIDGLSIPERAALCEKVWAFNVEATAQIKNG